MNNIKILNKLYPKLVITPQIRQALYILQLPHSYFGDYLKQKIAENLLLQSSDKGCFENKIKRFLNSNGSDNNDCDEQSYSNPNISDIALSAEKQTPASLNLQDYLLNQLEDTFLNKEELVIAEDLISFIDNNGYLRLSLDKFAEKYSLSLRKIEDILKTIQEFEPVGIGARNLKECLLIQLKDREQEQSLAYKIVHSCFKELSRKKYHIIAKKLNATIDEILKAVKEITSINPKPGTFILKEDPNVTVIPDVIVKIQKNKLQIEFNNADLPKLKINPRYKKLLKKPDVSEEIKEFINGRLKSALWLIKATEERQKNMQKVFQVIAKIQKQALCKGLPQLKPLRLKDVAVDTGLSISTVGRIISNKYILTPQGIIKLKGLFSVKTNLENGGAISRSNVFYQIKNIVSGNDKKDNLTDRMICDILQKEGIKIARRTITKYRNLLKILPSFLRI